MKKVNSVKILKGIVFSNDIIKRFVNKEAGDKELIFWTRAFVVITGAFGFAFAINISDIIYIWLTGIGMAAIIMIPAYLLAWFSKIANATGCIAGMCAGIIYCIVIAVGYIEPSVDEILIGIAINFTISITVSFFTLRPLTKTIDETYYWSERFNELKRLSHNKSTRSKEE